ncbi:MAG: energy transducer TonB [Putridiphycobacter sp.]
MRNEFNIYEKIDLYITGQLNTEEVAKFEIELKNNPDLQQKLDNQLLIIQAAKRKVLSNQIQAASKGQGNGFGFKGLIGVGLILLIGVLSIIYFKIDTSTSEPQIVKNKVSDEPNEDTFKPNDTKDLTNIDTTNELTENNVVDELNKVKSKKSNTKTIPESNLTDDFYDFNGLKCWVKPHIQTFEIDANKTETIEGENGTLIIVPKNSFLDTNNNEVQGKVEFELIEAYDLSDMVLYNLTTTSNGQALETGGMFYTNATQHGHQLHVNPSKPMMIQVPCVEEKPNMMAFESEIDSVGRINWKNPKPLEKFLTKIDLDLVDFLPEGFEDEVYASMPLLGYKEANRDLVDSLYYSMNYKDEKAVGEFWKREFKKFEEKYEEDKYRIEQLPTEHGNLVVVYEKIDACGINPISIKTIRENIAFRNSFVATKEFEERLQVLHNTEKGDEYLNIYLNNLDKNLWFSDSIVAYKIKSENNPFIKFYKERKTKVRNGDFYADVLTKYYNSKKTEYKAELNKIHKKSLKDLIMYQKQIQNKNKQQANTLTNVNVSRGNNYTVAWASFGWANIDSYLHMISKSKKPKIIHVKAINGNGNLKIYQWLGVISTLTPIIVSNFKGIIKFPQKGSEGSNKMTNTYTLSISKKGEEWFFGSKRYNPYLLDSININLVKTSLPNIKSQLSRFQGSTPLLKNFQESEKQLANLRIQKQKALEQQKRKIAEQQKVNEFLLRLKKICFESCTKEENSNQVIESSVIDLPTYPGGEIEMNKFIYENFIVSEECKAKMSGTIYVEFLVTENGRIENVVIKKGLNDCLNAEAIRVVKSMPNWIPSNNASASLYTIPIKVD